MSEDTVLFLALMPSIFLRGLGTKSREGVVGKIRGFGEFLQFWWAEASPVLCASPLTGGFDELLAACKLSGMERMNSTRCLQCNCIFVFHF